jgi:hypothetical protein
VLAVRERDPDSKRIAAQIAFTKLAIIDLTKGLNFTVGLYGY